MVVKEKRSDDARVFPVELDHSSASHRACESLRRTQKYYIDSFRRKTSDSYFSLPAPGFDLSALPLIQGAEVVNLHWVSGLLSPAAISRLQEVKQPIFWTLHDQRAFTGGCHFSAGCRNYENYCDRCHELTGDSFGVSKAGLAESMALLRPEEFVFIAPSRWMADCARRSVLGTMAQVEVIPNGIDTRVFKGCSKAEARKKLGLDPQSIIFLFGADNFAEKRKGGAELNRVIELCMAEPGFRSGVESKRILWACFGNSEGNESSFGVPVHGFGRVTDDGLLASIYAAADVFVLPSIEDNLPNTMLESLCCGTPVVGFDIGGVPDAVVSNETGLLAPALDCGAFAKALCRLAGDAVLRTSLSEKCLVEAPKRFSMEVQAQRYLALYKECGPRNLVKKKTVLECGYVPPSEAFLALSKSLARAATREHWNGLFGKLKRSVFRK